MEPEQGDPPRKANPREVLHYLPRLHSYNCDDMNRSLRVLCSILLAAALLSRAQAPAPNEKVPVIQGGAGPCSIELTVRGTDGKPVYAAAVKVHIAYGFGGIRKLDLEAGTKLRWED
jgi:hypothetical protein